MCCAIKHLSTARKLHPASPDIGTGNHKRRVPVAISGDERVGFICFQDLSKLSWTAVWMGAPRWRLTISRLQSCHFSHGRWKMQKVAMEPRSTHSPRIAVRFPHFTSRPCYTWVPPILRGGEPAAGSAVSKNPRGGEGSQQVNERSSPEGTSFGCGWPFDQPASDGVHIFQTARLRKDIAMIHAVDPTMAVRGIPPLVAEPPRIVGCLALMVPVEHDIATANTIGTSASCITGWVRGSRERG